MIQISLLWFGHQYCPLLRYFSFSPLHSLCISSVILSPLPVSFHLLSHLSLGFCFSLIDLGLLLFLLPNIIYRLLPLYLLRFVLVQSYVVHQPVLCCFRCCCIVRYSTRSISSLFPPLLV